MLRSILRLSLILSMAVYSGGPAWGACPKGDLTGDCAVDFEDVQAFAEQWLYPPASQADIDGLGGVDGRDFTILAGEWYQTGIPLVINEVMASNSKTKADPQGQYDDWIEIYNAGSYSIDTGGMHLTDNLDNPTKWQIPTGNPALTRILPGGYLLIWADNDVTDYPAGLHAGFELNADTGDEVGLFDANGVYIDSVEFPDQSPNVSYGRYPDGNDTWRFFGGATPQTRNVDAYLGQVADTKFSHNRGFYYSSFAVTIATETEEAVIYYTTDGTSPLNLATGIPTGTRYTGAVPISTTTCLRAVAIKPGWKNTNIDAETYIFPAHVLQQATNPSTGAQVVPAGYPSTWPGGSSSGAVTGDYQIDPDIVNHANPSDRFTTSDIVSQPTISLVVNRDDFFGTNGIYIKEALTYRVDQAPEKVASVEYIDTVRGASEQANCAIAMAGGVSGGGTSLQRWKSYKLSMRPRFKTTTDYGTYTGGPSKFNFKLFPDSPVERFDTFVLDGVLNHSWLHPGSDQQTTAMYIQDQYVADLHNAMGGYSPHGIYAQLYLNGLHWGMYYVHERPDHTWAAEMFGGEADEYDCIKHGSYMVNDSFGVVGNAFAKFNAMVAAASAVQSDPTNAAKYDTLCRMLDIDNFITYILANWFTGNHDWVGTDGSGKNWYATHRNTPDGRWRVHSWDAEHTIEGDNQVGNSPKDIHDKLKGNAAYLMRFADIIHKNFFNNGVLLHPNPANMYQALMTKADRAIAGESARWGDNRQSTPYTRSNWLTTQNSKLSSFFPSRTATVFGWLRTARLYPSIDAPVFRINGVDKHGGYISSTDSFSIAAASGTVYYTIDGSEVSTSAIIYTGPRTFDKSTHVKARLRSGTTWSALNEATYAVGPVAESLRITEIMYHPQETGDPNDPNEEFIELKNIGTETINLNLVKFTNGVDFTFPNVQLAAGEYLVVVKSLAAFAAQYPGFSGVIAGEYLGSLANEGERIELEDAAGQTILDFRYEDGWRNITDGQGYSLTIIDPCNTTVSRTSGGLVAHWALDDGAGAAAIDIAGTNNGALHGNPAWVAGRIGGALSFDGAGDYVSVAAVPALAGSSLTAEAWIRMSGFVGVWNPVLTQHNASSYGYYLYVYEHKPAFSLVTSRSYISANCPDVIDSDRWYHVAGTNDGSNLKIYVDGELKGSASSAGLAGVSYDAYIGYDSAGPTYYQGLIDDVRIYNRALAEHEFDETSSASGSWEQKDSWRASAYLGGSPGEDDSGIIPNPGAIVINELLAHSHAVAPDWIELYNTTDEDIDVGGWYLSDTEIKPKKYKFADGTKIRAYDYLVLYEDANFGEASTDPGRITGFGFSENGDNVYLRSAEAGILTGYREAESFGASYTGVSFGRYFKRSTGSYNFVHTDYNTPGWANAYPEVGPIVINEIMYNPDWPVGGNYTNDRYEYIELRNITAEPVTLYRFDKALPWKFTEGIEFVFPAWPSAVTIAGGDHIVVVRDPNVFTWRYPAVPAGKIFGPYTGQLANEGEQVELSMPGDIDEFGRRHYIRIDRVGYSDGSHPGDEPGDVDLWPVEADGGGKSLARKVASLYGNDPNNWIPAIPTPGGG